MSDKAPPVAMLRSFGRRHGRVLRSSQQSLLDEQLPNCRIDLPPEGTLDPARLFPGMRQVWLEIGFGGGEHLATQAKHHPDIGMIGCEPFEGGIVKLLRAVRDERLANVRIYGDDARLLLEQLPEASLARIFILFPDPWPKARHHKRRLIQLPLIELLSRKIRPGGELRIASDHADYVEWILGVMQRQSWFEWTAQGPEDFLQPPADWVETRYEQKTRQQGRQPTFLIYRRG